MERAQCRGQAPAFRHGGDLGGGQAYPLGEEPEQVGAAGAARDSITGARTAAADLPGRLSSAVLTPARATFGSELHTVAISAVLLVVAVTATALLRHVPPTGGETQPAEEATAQTVG